MNVVEIVVSGVYEDDSERKWKVLVVERDLFRLSSISAERFAPGKPENTAPWIGLNVGEFAGQMTRRVFDLED